MSQATAIEWTDLSWNPVHGCSKVSPGCAHCYAETLSLRYGQTKAPWTPANAKANVLLKPHKLREPLSQSKDWRGLGAAAAAAGKTDGKLVFVNSTSDLFHEEIPDEYIAAVFGVMAAADQHTFQILTKRPERMKAWFDWYTAEAHDRELLPADGSSGLEVMPVDVGFQEARGFGLELGEAYGIPWPLPNVWLGVSIENRRFVHRADLLRETPAAVRFISAEPLLGPLVPHGRSYDDTKWGWYTARRFGSEWNDDPGLDLTGIEWLIVGGESGPKHRPMRPMWARNLRDACLGMRRQLRDCEVVCDSGPAFFLKQLGGARPGGEALLDGREWREFPTTVRAVV